LKKLIFSVLVILLIISACGSWRPAASELNEDKKLNITVSIASIQWLVDQIGGEHVQTQSLTTSGDDPHTYEPSPSQMISVADSELYFTTGVEFEDVWIPKFLDANSDLQVIDISTGFERISMADYHHDHADDHADEHDHDHGGSDPHLWLSPQAMRQIAQNVAGILESADPGNASAYQSNLEKTLATIDMVDSQLNQQLSQTVRKQFLIIHPSLGYLADTYSLEMIPVEVNGQEPSPTELSEILSAAESYGINTLFTQIGNNPFNAQTLAEQAKITSIIEIDPMAYDWAGNMLFIGESLQKALN
jgi:zinc transport system substrate-binding protein